MKISANVYTNKKRKVSINLRMTVEDATAFMVDNEDTIKAMKQAVSGALSEKGHGSGEGR